MTAERIEALDGEGCGIALIAGETHRLPFTAPGDLVVFDDTGALALREPSSPNRTEPPCPHFGRCGGCVLQHLDDRTVAEWKRDQIARALRRVEIRAEIAETRTVPARDRRRVKLSFQRTKKTALLGFREYRSHRIVGINDCTVARPEIVEALQSLAEIIRPGTPRKRALDVTVTTSEAGLDVAVEDGKDLDLALRESLSDGAERADLARLTWNGEVIATRRAPVQCFGRAFVTPPAGAFLQASETGQRVMTEIVANAVGTAGSIADLFAGCGTFSLPLADHAPVTAVEADGAMIAALAAAWRQTGGLKRITAETRDLFRRPLLASELDFDAAVFDPPRAGARAQAAELARSDIPVIVGVSCMPSSFARDAKLLVDGGYRLEQVTPVDQFRWSTHVELVGVFRRD